MFPAASVWFRAFGDSGTKGGWLQWEGGRTPQTSERRGGDHPLFFVSVAAKGFSWAASLP